MKKLIWKYFVWAPSLHSEAHGRSVGYPLTFSPYDDRYDCSGRNYIHEHLIYEGVMALDYEESYDSVY